MSSKMPMVSLDKVEIKISTPIESVVLLDKITKQTGLSRPALINGYISDGLKRAGITMTADDLKRVDEIRAENLRKRNIEKAKKGIK